MAKRKKTGGRDFEKGNPGKPVGAKDHLPFGYIRAMYRQLLDDPTFLTSLKKTLRTAAKNPKLAIALCVDMADRLEGKPKQELEVAVRRSTTFELTAGPPETPTRE